MVLSVDASVWYHDAIAPVLLPRKVLIPCALSEACPASLLADSELAEAEVGDAAEEGREEEALSPDVAAASFPVSAVVGDMIEGALLAVTVRTGWVATVVVAPLDGPPELAAESRRRRM